MLAEEEMAQGQVVLKQLHDGTQTVVDQHALLEHLADAGVTPSNPAPHTQTGAGAAAE
jgi:hypothetical protein